MYRFTRKKLLRSRYGFRYIKLFIWVFISFIFYIRFINRHQPNTNALRRTLISHSQSNAASHIISESDTVSFLSQNHGLLNDMKIYIYNLPSKYNTDWLSNNRCSNHLFASEVAIYKALMNSYVRTFDPSEADFFFVPVYVSCNFSTVNGFPAIGHARALLSSAVELIKSEFKYWNRSNGSDHVFVASHDHGACFHAMEDIALANGIPEFMKNSIILQTFGVKHRHRCQDVEHVVIPPYVSSEKVRSTLSHSLVNGRRDIFVYFRGKMEVHPKAKGYGGRGRGSGVMWTFLPIGNTAPPDRASANSAIIPRWRVRTEILKKFGNNKRFYLKRHRFDGYQSEIARSVFCLCPRGWAPWSPRIVEAAALGCVPVIIANGIHLPLESAVPWPEISVTVAEKDVGKLAGVLDDVAATNLTSIQKRLWDPKVRNSLLFHDDLEDGDATWHILVALRDRLDRSLRKSRVLDQ